MLEDIGEEPRLAGFGVGDHRNVGDGEALFSGLDDGLHGVGKISNDVQAHGGQAGVSPEAGWGVLNLDASGALYNMAAKGLHGFFEEAEVVDGAGLAVTYNDVVGAVQDWLNEARNILLGVLVVTVSIDDNVGTQLKRLVKAFIKTRGQALVPAMADDVIGTELGGHGDGVVTGAVVDDERLDDVNAGY